MARYSRKLENVMKKYIDYGEHTNRLRALLNNESVESRYNLLMDVRVEKPLSSWTGLDEGARVDDLESIRCLLDGFPPDKKYDTLTRQCYDGRTPLHYAAFGGHSSIMTYLMADLSQQQKYDVLAIQDMGGDTALHKAEAYRAILVLISGHLQLKLLNVKNKYRKSPADIRPELIEEFPLATAHGGI